MLSSKLTRVKVIRQPRVVVLSTGNEVVDKDPQPGQIIDRYYPDVWTFGCLDVAVWLFG
jgi:molybdopterin biosynthesis enzyme